MSRCIEGTRLDPEALAAEYDAEITAHLEARDQARHSPTPYSSVLRVDWDGPAWSGPAHGDTWEDEPERCYVLVPEVWSMNSAVK